MMLTLALHYDICSMRMECKVYQGSDLVGHGAGADALSAVASAFADIQRRNPGKHTCAQKYATLTD